MQKLASTNGEIDVARAAASMNLNLTLSSNSTTLLEDVISVKQQSHDAAPFWFQIYLTKDLELSVPLIKRAESMSLDSAPANPKILFANAQQRPDMRPLSSQ